MVFRWRAFISISWCPPDYFAVIEVINEGAMGLRTIYFSPFMLDNTENCSTKVTKLFVIATVNISGTNYSGIEGFQRSKLFSRKFWALQMMGKIHHTSRNVMRTWGECRNDHTTWSSCRNLKERAFGDSNKVEKLPNMQPGVWMISHLFCIQPFLREKVVWKKGVRRLKARDTFFMRQWNRLL